MPLYTYKCNKCNKTFEAMLKIMDMDLPLNNPCPECMQSGGVEKVILAPNVVDAYHLGRIKNGAFQERLKQIKYGSGRKNNIEI